MNTPKVKRIYASEEAHEAFRIGAAKMRVTVVQFMDLMAERVPQTVQELKKEGA